MSCGPSTGPKWGIRPPLKPPPQTSEWVSVPVARRVGQSSAHGVRSAGTFALPSAEELWADGSRAVDGRHPSPREAGRGDGGEGGSMRVGVSGCACGDRRLTMAA